MTPGEVATRQNTDDAIRLQAAVRQKASQSKSVRRLTWLVTWALVLAGPATYYAKSDNSDLIGAIAAAWLLVTRLLLDRLEAGWRLQSAFLAEKHDRLVLGIPAHPTPLPGGVTPEESNAAADRYADRRRFVGRVSRRQASDPLALLRDWFAVPAALEGDALVLGCQRGAAEYARRMVQEWAWICRGAATTLVLANIALALATHLSLADYLVHLALPSVPAVLGLVDAMHSHRQGARLRAQIVNRADSAIAARMQHPIPPRLTRDLADLAWEIRKNSSGAPDPYYRLRRKSLESDSAAASAHLA